MVQKTTVHTFFNVIFEEDAHNGIRYLRDNLDYKEAKVFFDQARQHGSAEFEDHENRQFTLLHQDGAYTLVRR